MLNAMAAQMAQAQAALQTQAAAVQPGMTTGMQQPPQGGQYGGVGGYGGFGM